MKNLLYCIKKSDDVLESEVGSELSSRVSKLSKRGKVILYSYMELKYSYRDIVLEYRLLHPAFKNCIKAIFITVIFGVIYSLL